MAEKQVWVVWEDCVKELCEPVGKKWVCALAACLFRLCKIGVQDCVQDCGR